jgi:hypothetical protein
MDLTKVQNAINKAKAEKTEQAIALGESVPVPPTTDSVLHELVTSLNTGQALPAAQKIKAVDDLVEARSNNKIGGNGGSLTEALGNHGVPSTAPSTPSAPIQMGEERDDAFNNKINTNHYSGANGTLTEAMGHYPPAGAPAGYPAQYSPQPQQPQQPPQPQTAIPQQYIQQQLNPDVITEQINRAVESQNFVAIMQEALKSAIVEMYESDKFKTSLKENENVIKKMVKETIIELSKASSKK